MSPAINRADALCTILFDVVCALIGIIGTSPLWIVGVVGILVSDWGPIFYTAHRIGKDNKPFKMYKFRSMRVLREVRAGAEASLRPEEDRIFPFGHLSPESENAVKSVTGVQ